MCNILSNKNLVNTLYFIFRIERNVIPYDGYYEHNIVSKTQGKMNDIIESGVIIHKATL